MAPSERTATNNNSKTITTRRTTKTPTTRRTRQQRRTNFKKQQKQNNTQSKQLECSSQDSSKEKDMEISEVIDVSNNSASCCSTPKGKKFKIPEISTCPPAPKKQRVLSNFSLRRSPLSFFAPPDLEHFFLVALRDVSV